MMSIVSNSLLLFFAFINKLGLTQIYNSSVEEFILAWYGNIAKELCQSISPAIILWFCPQNQKQALLHQARRQRCLPLFYVLST